MLLQNFARRGTGHIHGDIAAADHHYFLADREAVAEVGIQQKVDAFVHAVQVDAGNGEVPAAMRADGEHHRVEALLAAIREMVKSRPAA